MCWTSGRRTVRDGAAEAESGRPSSSECYTDELLFRKMSIADLEVFIHNTLSQPKQQQHQQQQRLGVRGRTGAMFYLSGLMN